MNLGASFLTAGEEFTDDPRERVIMILMLRGGNHQYKLKVSWILINADTCRDDYGHMSVNGYYTHMCSLALKVRL